MNHTNFFLWYFTSVIFMSRCDAIWKKQQFLCKEHCHWRFHLKCGKPLSPSTLNVVIRNPKLIDGSVITFPCFSFLLALEKHQLMARVLFHCELRVTGCVNSSCCSAPLPFANPLVFWLYELAQSMTFLWKGVFKRCLCFCITKLLFSRAGTLYSHSGSFGFSVPGWSMGSMYGVYPLSVPSLGQMAI